MDHLKQMVDAAVAGDAKTFGVSFDVHMTSIAAKALNEFAVETLAVDPMKFHSIKEDSSANVVANVQNPDPKPDGVIARDGKKGGKKKEKEKTAC